MKPGDDPRPDQSQDGPKFPAPPPTSQPRPAPGGVGTGTEDDPAATSPNKQDYKKTDRNAHEHKQ